MPVPDVIFRDYEAESQAALKAKWAEENRVMAVCNALLAKQQECRQACHICESKCAELQAWIDLKGQEE
jgi:hypothetical protein